VRQNNVKNEGDTDAFYYFYTDSKAHSLDDLLVYITAPNFELVASDIIMILEQDNQTFEETKFKISLNKLVKNVKK
jgi:hypothetical protein